jgi:hypothetical protein
MATRSKAAVVAVVSDVHAGSTVAVCPPKVTLDDGGEYVASPAQLWLWLCWLDYWAQIEAKRAALGADLYIVFNGDLVDGNHHGTTQILSGNPNAQAAVWDACVAVPLALKPKQLAFTRGTDVHVGQSASAEERIAKGLKKDKRPVFIDADTGNASHWWLRMTVQGKRLDFAHHGRVGTRPWTKPNVVTNLAAEIFFDHCLADAEAGERAMTFPHLAVRSHMHQFVDTGTTQPVRVVQTPAWQLGTSFIHRIAAGKLGDIGGLAVTIVDGALEVDPIRYRPKPVKAWAA